MDASQQIELFDTLFYVCLAIAVVGFGLAVFLFFFFDIRSVRALMTGKAKRQTIERMAEQHAKTGRLQAVSENIKSGRIGPVIQNPAPAANETTAPLDIIADTTILQPQAVETTVLSAAAQGEECGETAVLAEQPRTSQPGIRFEVTENTLVIHTAEII